jgi:methionyl-tRNA formyltransferase
MKIVFFGTPEYVLPILKAVHKRFVTGPGKSPIAAVVTQSPKPTGRKQILSYSPIDKWAHEHKVPCFYTANDLLTENLDIELGILASYGEIIKKEVINLFPQGILVVHPSLLPEFRWGSPVPAAIITNSTPTGVSIIKMDDKFDHGPIVVQAKEGVLTDDTNATLRDRLFLKSADVLVESLEPYIKGKIRPKAQDDSKATFARIFSKDEAFIPLEYLNTAIEGNNGPEWKIDFIKGFSMEVNALNLDRFVRAMLPWPTAWTKIMVGKEIKRLKLLRCHVEDSKLIIDEVQLEGKDPVNYKQFKQAYPNLI